jgi:hypothetical protein
MEMARKAAIWLAAALIGVATAQADVWDLGTDPDNDTGSDNEIVHGLSQVHDLAAQAGGTVEDVDWYPLRMPDSRSFEIRIDGLTGDTAGLVNPFLELLASDGTTVVASADVATDFGVARSLRFASTIMGGTGYTTYFVRVASPLCGLNCTGSDEYRIHAFDTTLALPRYNNGNGQVTFLILQNPTNRSVNFFAGAFSANGSLVGAFGATLAPYATSVTNLSTVNGGALNNTSGSMVIRNDGPYQGLTGKGVALEPATGFTFDTPVTPAPR